jgi:hypothetical protein
LPLWRDNALGEHGAVLTSASFSDNAIRPQATAAMIAQPLFRIAGRANAIKMLFPPHS